MSGNPYRDENPYQSPEVVKAELVKPKRRETFDEALGKAIRWSAATFAAMIVIAGAGVGMGQFEIVVAIFCLFVYWVPRLVIARGH